MKLSKAIALALLLIPAPVLAEDSLYYLMNSYHYDRSRDYRESHELVGWEHDNYFIETFITSKENRAWYVGYIKRDVYCFTESTCLGFDAGLLSGYNLEDKSISPMVFPTLSWTQKNWGVDVRFGYSQVVAFRFRYIF